MSEYWKSLPRKFCDVCKCWFADNKASIDFHERGKRHQENAQKRIQDIQKRGIKDAKKQKQLEDDMARIEKAALAAYKKDLQNNLEPVSSSALNTPSLASTNFQSNFVELPQIKKTAIKQGKKKIPTNVKQKKDTTIVKEDKDANIVDDNKKTDKIWYEAVTEEGHKYYWNTKNSESQWEAPEEGYVSIEEQNSQGIAEKEGIVADDELPIKKDEEDSESSEEEKEVICAVGPQPKIDPYGNWVTVEHSVPVEIDFQLPKPSEDVVEVFIPITKDETKLKFKEKVIGQLAGTDSSETVTFKKRKFNGNLKKNTRQRTADDD